MIKFTDMLDDVMTDVPGCSEALAVHALRNAAIELHTKSWLYTQDCDAQQTVIGQAEYDLDQFAGYRVIGVSDAKFNDATLAPTAVGVLNMNTTRWEDDTGTPTHYFTTDFATLRLYKIPDVVGTLYAKVVLTPSKTATGVENFIYDLYSEQLAAGAKARLMLIPDKPYTNPDVSREYRAQFAEAITDAKWRAHMSLSSTQLQAFPQVQLRRP